MPDLTVFLDTCALLYLAAESDRLSHHAVRIIDNAKAAFISPISAWEISLKCVRGQLKLPEEPEPWFEKALSVHSLELYPLTPAILMRANRLPWHHRDPADRFIIASALDAKSVLISTDGKLRQYDVEIVG
jgi:PIN domain nuclease of toxin-antitoxin system